MEQVYYTAEGSLKSADYDIRQSLVRVTTVKPAGDEGMKVPASVSSQLAYEFF